MKGVLYMSIFENLLSHIRVSKYTFFLLIGAVIILIINSFYDPLNRNNMIELMWGKDPDIDIIVLNPADGEEMIDNAHIASDEEIDQMLDKRRGEINTYMFFFHVFCPVMFSMGEFYSYLASIDVYSGTIGAMLSSEVLIIGYFIVGFFIEKLHGRWHRDETPLTICVDISCLEIIVMFFFDMIFSVIVKAVSDSETSFLVLLLFCLVLILPAFFSMVFYLVYGLVAITVSMMIPLFLTTLAEKINQPFANVVFFLSLLFFSRVVWMLISEKVYDFILKKMTGNRISIENNVIFDYRHTSE